MSLSELLVIIIVAFFVLKSEDFRHITKKIGDFIKFFTKTKKDIIAYLDLSQNSVAVDDDLEKINFYLEKITTLGGKYDGEYSLEKIKDYYQKLVKESIKSELESGYVPKVKKSNQ